MAAKRFPPMALLAFGAALSACQSASIDGQDLAFVQEMMQESAELEQTPKRAERAVQAVQVWRGANE